MAVDAAPSNSTLRKRLHIVAAAVVLALPTLGLVLTLTGTGPPVSIGRIIWPIYLVVVFVWFVLQQTVFKWTRLEVRADVAVWWRSRRG